MHFEFLHYSSKEYRRLLILLQDYSDNLKLNNELHDLKITVMIVCNRPSLMSFTHTQFLMEALCTQRMVTTPIFTIHDRESVL